MLPIADALPSGEASKYVAAAYVVFVVLILVYVAIMAAKLQRIERELRELAGFAEHRVNGDSIAPGRGSEEQSISVSSGPSESRGGGA
jgi:CcmD family protein